MWFWSLLRRRRLIGREELWRHRWRRVPQGVAQGCWVSIQGLVLQLPVELFDKHPGGSAVLRDAAGHDVTEAFAGHSQHARRWADAYVIGYCPEVFDQAIPSHLANTAPCAGCFLGIRRLLRRMPLPQWRVLSDDHHLEFVEENVDIQKVLVGIVHLVSIITFCRLCCCTRDQPADQADVNAEVNRDALQPQKSLCSSYLLWLNPLFPAHLFYLDRLVHALMAVWTLNFCFLGWLADAFLMPFYVRSFNHSRCAPNAPSDNSRRRLLCKLPLLLLGLLAAILILLAYLPAILHKLQVVDIDRIAAQTQVNPYELLQLSQGASPSEARMAYRNASLRWHPDRNPGCGKECEEKMSEITKAYDLIKKRQAPPPPDRTWEGLMQAIFQDWKHVFEVIEIRKEN
ncbi:unnamed protein product [Effrenium voratum]|nr:unnamed protein product [Effrenium voratum]